MPRALNGLKHIAQDMGQSLRATAAASWTQNTIPEFVTAAGWSIACWVKSADFSSAQSILTNSSVAGAPQFRITASRQLEVLPRTAGASLLSAAVIVRGMWHHVVATHDAAAVRTTLYCDGVVVARQVGTIGGVTFAAPTGGIVGSVNINTGLARLSLWGRELTQAEVQASGYRSAGPTPVARYRMSEGVGSTLIDDMGGASASSGSMTYTDDVPVYPARLGQDWGSIYQVGASYLTLPSSGSNNPGLACAGMTSIQASVWVKLSAARASIDLLRINTSSTVGLRLQLDGGNNLIATIRAGPDGGTTAQATSKAVPLALGRWVHYSVQAMLSDGAAGKIRLYRNGLLIQEATVDFSGQTSIAWATGGTVGFVGGGTSGANPVPGWVGPIRIEQALTNAQLRSLVYTGKSGAAAPVLEWRHTTGLGGTSANTGYYVGCNATLTGAAVWSLDSPW